MITNSEPVDMVDTAAKPSCTITKQIAGVVLFGRGNFLKKDPIEFNRKEKLAYIVYAFSIHGPNAFENCSPFLMEIRCSPGLSAKAFNDAQSLGMSRFNARNAET